MKTTTQLAGRLCSAAFALTPALLLPAWAQVGDLPGGPGVNQLNLTDPASAIAADIEWLHWVMLAICAVIFVAVFGVMFYSILKHRKSVGAKPANFHDSVKVEIAWTIVPFLIVIAMGAMATRTVVAQKDTSNADLTIKITGYQWKWGYDYLMGEGEGISFMSRLDPAHRLAADSGNPPDKNDYLLRVDNPLVVPVGKKVRIITTANDVIHAWAVPAFGVRQDAIPGFVRDNWFRADRTGDFFGQCVELCGREHAFMPIHVRVVTADEYTAWVRARQAEMQAVADDPARTWQLAELIQRGQQVYNANCMACHRADGKGAGPIKPLDGSQIVLGDVGPNLAILLQGAAGGAMPAFRQLSDVELAAVMTYTKNSWGNATGRAVQPAEVTAARR